MQIGSAGSIIIAIARGIIRLSWLVAIHVGSGDAGSIIASCFQKPYIFISHISLMIVTT